MTWSAAPAGPGFLAPVGIRRDEHPDALTQQRIDRIVSPVAGVGQRDPDRLGDPGRLQFGAGRFDHRLQAGGVQRLGADVRGDDDLIERHNGLGVVALHPPTRRLEIP
jgi:hypothetical protein